MPRSLIVALIVVALPLQAVAQSQNPHKVVFEGLVAFVVEPLEITIVPNMCKEVRAVMLDAEQTDSPHKTTHLAWLAVSKDGVASGPPPDKFMHGMPVWSLAGREVRFSVTDTAQIEFNHAYITELETLHSGYGTAKPDIWNSATPLVGARVQLRGGVLAADSLVRVPCEFNRENAGGKTVKCALEACDRAKDPGLARTVAYQAKFDTIEVFTLGADPDKDPRKFRIELNADAVVKFVNLPLWSIEGESHFREFYDLSPNGPALDWKQRCNVFDLTPPPATARLTTDKIVFCPPVVFGK